MADNGSQVLIHSNQIFPPNWHGCQIDPGTLYPLYAIGSGKIQVQTLSIVINMTPSCDPFL